MWPETAGGWVALTALALTAFLWLWLMCLMFDALVGFLTGRRRRR